MKEEYTHKSIFEELNADFSGTITVPRETLHDLMMLLGRAAQNMTQLSRRDQDNIRLIVKNYNLLHRKQQRTSSSSRPSTNNLLVYMQCHNLYDLNKNLNLAIQSETVKLRD